MSKLTGSMEVCITMCIFHQVAPDNFGDFSYFALYSNSVTIMNCDIRVCYSFGIYWTDTRGVWNTGDDKLKHTQKIFHK